MKRKTWTFKDAQDARLTRLCGHRSDIEGQFGGMPLSPAFGSILSTILDDGPAGFEVLRSNVLARVRREKRAAFIYRNVDGDPYDLFVKDLLDQLLEQKLLTEEGGQYALGPAFTSDKCVCAIPADDPVLGARGQGSQEILVRTKANRELTREDREKRAANIAAYEQRKNSAS